MERATLTLPESRVRKCVSHGLRTGIAVTAAKDRSVWTSRPPVG
jgi:hypothetical protein